MRILDHKLVDIPFVKAHASGGALAEPMLICLHDTAGRLSKGNSVDWFCANDCPTSAHIVVERDGSITQMVAFNKIAFHAGKSSYKGKSIRGSCNSFTIGIEIVNPGKLDENGKAWFHQGNEQGFTGAEKARTAEHGPGWWLPYTPEQIDAVTALCKALVANYNSIVDVTTHWAISPGRKIDPNPLFPIDRLRAEVFEGLLPAMEATPVSDKLKGSRIQTTSQAGEAGAVGLAAGGIGLSAAEALGYGGQILPMIKTYGLEAFILVMLCLAAFFAVVKHFRREDHATGKTAP